MVFSPPQQSPLAFLGSGWESHPECPIFPRVLTEDISQRATSWVWKSGAQNVGSDMDRVDVARSLCVFRSLLLFSFIYDIYQTIFNKRNEEKNDQTNRVVLSHQYDRIVKLMAKSN